MRGADKRAIQGEGTEAVRRLRAGNAADKAAINLRLGAIGALLWESLPAHLRHPDKFLKQPAEAFQPSRDQLHRMLDMALVLQAGAATPQEMMLWRLLGMIVLQRAFGGLADIAVWQSGRTLGDGSGSALRRHLLTLLQVTPHLVPADPSAQLTAAMIALETGDLKVPDLLRSAQAAARELRREAATFAIVDLIEFFAAQGVPRDLLLAEAQEATGVEAGTIERWRENIGKSAEPPVTWTDYRKRFNPPPGAEWSPSSIEFIRAQFKAANKDWRAAGGGPKGKRAGGDGARKQGTA